MSINFRKNPKSFNALVNDKRKTKGYPSQINGDDSTDAQVVANMFAGLFEQAYSKSMLAQSEYNYFIQMHNIFSNIVLSKSEI